MNILILIFFFLILLAAAVVLFIFLSRASQNNARRAGQARQRMEAALEQGTLASAELVSARTLSVREGDAANMVRVTLQVMPPTGEAYVSVNTWEVKMEAMGVLQPGQFLAVIIDPRDSKRVSPNFSGSRLRDE